jgi:hypothetical protein
MTDPIYLCVVAQNETDEFAAAAMNVLRRLLARMMHRELLLLRMRHFERVFPVDTSRPWSFPS